MDYTDIEQVFDLVDNARRKEAERTGFPIELVTDEEKAEAYRWVNGQELKHIIDTPGYEIIISKLTSYMDSGIKTLFRNTDPSDKDAVLANFYVGFAACEVLERLKNDVEADLRAADSPPDVIKAGMRIARGVVEPQ